MASPTSPVRHLYSLHGLIFDSELELCRKAYSGGDAGQVDVRLELGDATPVPEEPPAGELLAELTVEGQPIYSAAEVTGGFVLRLHRLCDFEVDKDLARASCRPADGAEPEILSLVVRGAFSAFVLGLRGQCSLHASAVDVRGDGVAVAFVGNSGSGKSTVAALMCLSGSSFITDDLMRLDGSPVPGWVGTCEEVRLRSGAAGLAAEVQAAWSGRTSRDERLSLCPPPTKFGNGPIAAVVFPVLARPGAPVEASPLSPMEATLAMSGAHRLAGWRRADVLRSHLNAVAELAESVPAFRLTVPFEPERAAALSAEVAGVVAAVVDAWRT